MPFQNDIFPNLTPPVPGAVLLEVYVYGEGQTNDKVKNLRGQLYQHKDGGGLQQINSYDFKGNVRQTQQQLLDDATLTDVDWGASPVLSTETFTSSVTYDALNRPVTQTDPGSNIQAFTYDKGGLLKTVTLNNDDYVNDIHYDAKGQRQAIWYGNGTKTSYTYDPDTFRLRRLLTVNLSTNAQLQDLNYYYDPVGNITTIRDDAQQTLFFNNSVVSPTQAFTYDALYRLITATGRELKGTASFGSEDNWNDAPWMGQPQPGNGSVVQNYTQQYTYDAVGNILSLQHTAGTGSYTRTYDVDMASNKLLSTTVGSNTYHYTHDARGNMLTMPHLQNMAWNAQNELNSITPGSNNTYYQYSNGQRVRKYTDKGIIKEERIYLGSYEIYRKFDQASSLIIERTTVHISDDTGRIAMLEKRTYGTAADDNNTAAMLTRYIYSNHLQSASLELDESAAIISYEEYHPYGTTSYQANNAAIKAVAKRYRYTGKERDEESGLYYHGARYYIPWLCRWSASDPLESKYAGMSPYNYGFNNPVKWTDSTGMGPEDKGQEKKETVSEEKKEEIKKDAYYNKKGIFLGYDENSKDDKVFIAEGKNEDGSFINPKELSISHSKFRQEAATIYGESSAFKMNEMTDNLQKEMYALGSVYQRNSVAFAKNSYKAKEYLRLSPLEINKSIFKYTANAAIINAVTGGFDYSYGATNWDGGEQGQYGATDDRFSADGYELHKNTIGWSISDKHYQTWKSNVGKSLIAPQVSYTPDNGKKFNKYYIANSYRFISTAVYGNTIFWRELSKPVIKK